MDARNRVAFLVVGLHISNLGRRTELQRALSVMNFAWCFEDWRRDAVGENTADRRQNTCITFHLEGLQLHRGPNHLDIGRPLEVDLLWFHLLTPHRQLFEVVSFVTVIEFKQGLDFADLTRQESLQVSLVSGKRLPRRLQVFLPMDLIFREKFIKLTLLNFEAAEVACLFVRQETSWLS